MIESIEFVNFKALRNATLPLAPFTLLLGPNGSGKSSVLQALQGVAGNVKYFGVGGSGSGSNLWVPAPSAMDVESPVRITLRIRRQNISGTVAIQWLPNSPQVTVTPELRLATGAAAPPKSIESLRHWLDNIQTYALDPVAIASAVPVNSGRLQWNGKGLAAVLDDIQDDPERWKLLNSELCEWLPEYNLIQFDRPVEGQKAIALRTKKGNHRIPASELSQGTLVALALLTLAYLPNPPSLIGLEEIDRGLHPRLLGHLQSALYRLSYPESCGEKQRPPIQVIATTHSPYLLDLYREHPEEVVLAEKEGLEVQFKQLSKIEHFDEILGDGPLSEIWYSGVLGGVSVKP